VPIRSTKGDFHVNALKDCTPTPEGISVPTWVQLAANAVQLDKVDAARAVINADIRRRAVQEAVQEEQAKRERSKHNVETKLRRRAFAQQRRAEQEAEWLAQPMRASVLAANGGQIPSFLDVKPAVNGVYAHHQHWQSWLYGIHIRGKTGSSFSMADLYETLNQAGIQLSPSSAKRSRAVLDWIDYLELNAHVVANREQDNTWRITVIDRAERLADRAIVLKQAREAAQAQRLANFKRNLEHHDELRELAARNRARYGR
jgi:hypothetical protein